MGSHRAADIRRRFRISEIAGRYGVDLKQDGPEWLALCPFHSEDTPSFNVRERGGVETFKCFGCGEQGDVIDFVQQITGEDFKTACVEIAGDAPPSPTLEPKRAADDDNPYAAYRAEWPPRNVAAIVAGKKTPPLLNPKRIADAGRKFTVYTPTLVHPYRGRDGRLLGYVLRCDGEKDGKPYKFTPTILWVKNAATGFSGWSHAPMIRPRPLYGLDQLAARPGAQVLLVEGEKCKDAAAAKLPKMVPVSWCGGGKAWQLTNWEPLRGRSVVIWMDNDAPGEATMLGDYERDRDGNLRTPLTWRLGVIETLLHLECRVKVIDRPRGNQPDGWDVADAINDKGWGEGELVAYMKGEAFAFTAKHVEQRKERLKGKGPPEGDPSRSDEAGGGRVLTPTIGEPIPQAIVGAQAEPDEGQRQARAGKTAAREIAGNVVSLHGAPIDTGNENAWRGRLLYGPDGDKLKVKSFENYRLFVTHHDQLRGLFAFNAFSNLIHVMRTPPWGKKNGHAAGPRELADNDVAHCRGFLEQFQLTPSAGDMWSAIQLAAVAATYNPVLEYFNALAWDGVPRIAGGRQEGEAVAPWLSEYMGAVDNDINRAFGIRWLISAVARAYDPGCKADTMLILESPQGMKKSSALRILATLNGKAYFTENIPDMHSKDAEMVLQGVLIAEIAELAAFNRTDFNEAKKFISTQSARLRPPYGKSVVEFPRTAIFCGTVNPGQSGYLRDPTGARRYWPVRVTDIDLDRLRADREQLWAEAVHLYKAGEKWHLTEAEGELAEKVQRLRYEDDVWKPKIDKHIRGLRSVTVDDIMMMLSIPVERQSPMVAKRIIDHLSMAGWQKRATADMTGVKEFVFHAPDLTTDPPPAR